MRKLAWFLMVGILATAIVGCSSEAPAPEDDAFGKQLAEAQSKNTEPIPTKGGMPKTDGSKAPVTEGDKGAGEAPKTTG